MKRIDMLIWKCLVDDIGEYVSSVDMCQELGLSRRQLLTRITKLHYPHVIKDANAADRMAYFKLDCDTKEAHTCTVQLLSKYYNCSKNSINSLIKSVPTDRSVTLDEIDISGMGFTTKDLINIMNMIPCIEVTKTWSKNRYRRLEDV